MSLEKILVLLREASRSPESLEEVIPQFQKLVWENDDLECEAEEDVRELAHDLDFFQGDPRARDEDPSFIGADEALGQIRQLIRQLEEELEVTRQA